MNSKRARIIALTTDFGAADWFVGTMKGVIARLAPRTQVIDLTHQIPPGDIRAGAFALLSAYRFFPHGTIHLAVVDPGVGSARKALAVRTTNYVFVGPDNGLLSWALGEEQVEAIHALENPAYFLPVVSGTFHGRDIFAPVAARLSRGYSIRRLGSALERCQQLVMPPARQTREGVEGEVICIDHFGNAITNLRREVLKFPAETQVGVRLGRRRLCPLAGFYQAVPLGKPVALFGSSDFLEIAVNGGNAAEELGLQTGDKVLVSMPAA
jgi:S-adenosyl-L-methionine hydrolase (adenosine-forming)